MGRKVLTAIMAAGLMLAGALFALAEPPQWLKGTPEEKFATLEKIQEALGSVMIEYNYRATTMFFAAKGGNWDLASYELKEAREIQEVGETTRPQFAEALKARYQEIGVGIVQDTSPSGVKTLWTTVLLGER